MKEDIEINKPLEEELDKQFPKGDKSRGKALVINAIANIELDRLKKKISKLQNQLRNRNREYNEVKEAKTYQKSEAHRVKTQLKHYEARIMKIIDERLKEHWKAKEMFVKLNKKDNPIITTKISTLEDLKTELKEMK